MHQVNRCPAAGDVAEEDVAFARQTKDRVGEAYTLGKMGFAALQLGELDRPTWVLEGLWRCFGSRETSGPALRS